MRIGLLDPGVRDRHGTPSINLGDKIIAEAVDRELASLFPSAQVLRFSTHVPLSRGQRKDLSGCDLRIIGGSNLLSSHMWKYKQWKISWWEALGGRVKDVVLFGTGWWQYEDEADAYTRWLLRSVLSRDIVHAVRDKYTAAMLTAAGFPNVVNTSCPTLWPFGDGDAIEIPSRKAPGALLMVTDYMKDPAADGRLIELLRLHYESVVAWPQGTGDAEYLTGLGFKGTLLEHSVTALDEFLSGNEVDYIGTRLHGGIRCMLAKKRSLILQIDNRAKEIGGEVKFPSFARTDIDEIERWIERPAPTNIHLNPDRINAWRAGIRAAGKACPA
jgi:hypothetical protein